MLVLKIEKLPSSKPKILLHQYSHEKGLTLKNKHMKKEGLTFLFLVFFLIGFEFVCFGQKKKIVVVGSSTAYGFGATPDPPRDSSWVNRTKRYFRGLGIIDTLYNLGNPSTTTYAGMPTGFIPPTNVVVNGITYNRSSFQPDSSHNISKALSFNPDIVIINYPTNDIGDDFLMKEEFLFNLRTMYVAVVAAGKVCYVTTTQPRNYLSAKEKDTLYIAKDSILQEYTYRSLNFYDTIVDPKGTPTNPITLNINPIFDHGDGIHVNNAGHNLLFQVVMNRNIFPIVPLPLKLVDFTASLLANEVTINFSIVNEIDPATLEIQSSKGGMPFETFHQEQAKRTSQETYYTWADQKPAIGKSFYRLKITENGITEYSKIVLVIDEPQTITINKVFLSDPSTLMMEFSLQKNQTVGTGIYNSIGALLKRQDFTLNPPAINIPINISNLINGEYFLKIVTTQGYVTKRFMKF
jgi:acyl-CoA thioesterase I